MKSKKKQRLFGIAWLIFATYLCFRASFNLSLRNFLISLNISTAYRLIGGFILGLITVYISHKLEGKDKRLND
ncbi:hypothetical protein ABID42_003466 [Arcicella rosea]|uniref:hypothetical protein n=1 Tax=Arcicella rosea TaxID=502909 RepID=UPI00345D8284